MHVSVRLASYILVTSSFSDKLCVFMYKNIRTKSQHDAMAKELNIKYATKTNVDTGTTIQVRQFRKISGLVRNAQRLLFSKYVEVKRTSTPSKLLV